MILLMKFLKIIIDFNNYYINRLLKVNCSFYLYN